MLGDGEVLALGCPWGLSISASFCYGAAGLPPELMSAKERLSLLLGLLLALVSDVWGQDNSWYILCLLQAGSLVDSALSWLPWWCEPSWDLLWFVCAPSQWYQLRGRSPKIIPSENLLPDLQLTLLFPFRYMGAENCWQSWRKASSAPLLVKSLLWGGCSRLSWSSRLQSGREMLSLLSAFLQNPPVMPTTPIPHNNATTQ